MKSKLFILISCALLILSGCKTEEPETGKTTSPVSIGSNLSTPSWTVPGDYDYSSSLTAIVKTDLTLSFPDSREAEQAIPSEDDVLAAFMGDECVGKGTLVDGLFFLYVSKPDSTDIDQVTLRYYNARLKNIFISPDVFRYVNDAQYGSVKEPLMPIFRIDK